MSETRHNLTNQSSKSDTKTSGLPHNDLERERDNVKCSPDYKSPLLSVSIANSPSDEMRGDYCLDQEHED